MPLFAIQWYNYALAAALILISLIIWLVVLIQRGKGGGLAGAFGGAGGSSAFGSKAGDAFTKITLYLAAIWVLFIMINVKTMQHEKPAKPAEVAVGEPGETPVVPVE